MQDVQQDVIIQIRYNVVIPPPQILGISRYRLILEISELDNMEMLVKQLDKPAAAGGSHR